MSEAFAADHVAEFSRARPWRLPVLEQPIQRESATDHEHVRASAAREGFAIGHAEGYAAGLAEGRAVTEKLEALLSHLTRPLADLNAEVERALVALTIEMARRLAHLEIDLDPTRVTSVVREAVEALGHAPRDVRVYLHPDDAAIVRRALAGADDAQDWKILADDDLNRGDCRVIADGARVDGRLDSRQATLAGQLLGEGE
jgi:flagellar assembly protein FliH